MAHVVQPGESLYGLSRRFGIPLQNLIAANPQLTSPSVLMVGQLLQIPAVGQPPNTFTYLLRPGETLYQVAQRFGISLLSLVAANPQLQDPARILPGQVIYIPRPPAPQYVVQPGDSLYLIGQRFGVTVQQLVQANPSIQPQFLQAGQRLNLPPAGERQILIPRDGYGYDQMVDDLNRLSLRYPFLQLGSIGETVLGRPIPVVRIGEGAKEVHYNGSFHAQEWITTPLLMKFIEVYAGAISRGEPLGQFNPRQLFRDTSLWVVPMVNPDGVELVQRGIGPDNPYYETVLRANGGSTDFSGWAANIRGVDLNNQFPADWEREADRGEPEPAPRNYSGPSPLSEPEAQAMASFTRAHNFRLVIAFHTQGEEIYWGYEGLEPPESAEIVRVFAEASGYRPVRYVESWAGYKDWFIQDWRRPGFTVEVGRGVNPLPISQFWEIWSRTVGIMLAGLVL